MNELKKKPPMSTDQVLEHNLILKKEGVRVSKERLKELWIGLLLFYSNGYIDLDNPLKEYQELYLKNYEHGLGIIALEKDLLTLMSIKLFED